MQDFPITGGHVTTEDLLKLQLLTIDLSQLRQQKTRSRRAGDQRSVFRGQGREFIEMRQYQPGDDVRQIDWRLTARKQTPYVQVMEEDRHSEHLIWLDLSASSYFGTQRCLKSVMACHWAAFIIWRFVRLKHPIRLVIEVGADYQQQMRIGSQAAAAEACRHLAHAHQYLADNFRSLVSAQELPEIYWRGRPNLWWIADMVGSNVHKLERLLTQQQVQSLNCLQPLDRFDLHLPNAGTLPVKNQEQTGWIQTSSRTVQHRFAQRLQQQQQQLQNICWQHNGQLFMSPTDSFSWQEVQAWPLFH